jgi:uncharacterized protein (TIGR03083 family)
MNSAASLARNIPQTVSSDAAEAYLSVMTALADSLETLTPEQWERDTDCTGWSVRELAGHMVGAQEDARHIPTVLWRRMKGRRRYPHLAAVDAANQIQVDDHATHTSDQLCRDYRANAAKVARRVRNFPSVLSGVPVDPTMAPGNRPLRLGYLFNVIYLRDAWMHGFDLARAVGLPRTQTTADALVLEQIMGDLATAWGEGSGVELHLTGELEGTWRIGSAKVQARVQCDGVELCRSLSGRTPESAITTVAGETALADRLSELRIVF